VSGCFGVSRMSLEGRYETEWPSVSVRPEAGTRVDRLDLPKADNGEVA